MRNKGSRAKERLARKRNACKQKKDPNAKIWLVRKRNIRTQKKGSLAKEGLAKERLQQKEEGRKKQGTRFRV
jgi:hypothetical protein